MLAGRIIAAITQTKARAVERMSAGRAPVPNLVIALPTIDGYTARSDMSETRQLPRPTLWAIVECRMNTRRPTHLGLLLAGTPMELLTRMLRLRQEMDTGSG